MKFLPSQNVVVRWDEPGFVHYVIRTGGSGSLGPAVALWLSCIAGGIYFHHPVLAVLGVFMMAGSLAGKYLYPRWPGSFPVLNIRGILYDDRIELRGQRYCRSIMLGNIAECRCQNVRYKNEDYPMLLFKPKRPILLGGLREVIIPTAQAADEVMSHLRGRGIAVTPEPIFRMQ